MDWLILLHYHAYSELDSVISICGTKLFGALFVVILFFSRYGVMKDVRAIRRVYVPNLIV
jgi:hypothetical protein